MPTLLPAARVHDALSRLSGWAGGTDGISRTIALDPSQYVEFRERLKVCCDAMNHQPIVHRRGEVTQVSLRTAAEGGVTECDIALAARIEHIVRVVRQA